MAFAAQWHTPHNRCVRFAPAVAGDHATLATGRPLRLTRTGLSPAGQRQLSWRTSNPWPQRKTGLLRYARNDEATATHPFCIPASQFPRVPDWSFPGPVYMISIMSYSPGASMTDQAVATIDTAPLPEVSSTFLQIAVLAALAATGTLATNILLPSLPQMAASLHVSTAEVTASITVFLAVFAVGQLAVGPISDRYGRRLPVLAGFVVFIAGSIWCGLAIDLPNLLIGRVIQAAGACSTSVLSRAIARDLFSGAALGRAMALIMIAMAAAPGFSPLLGGALDHTLGWRSEFAFVGIFAAIAAVAYAAVLGETHNSTRIPLNPLAIAKTYLGLSADRRFLIPAATVALIMGGLFAMFSAAPRVLIEGLGFTPIQLGLFFAGTVLIVFAAGMLATKLAPRFGLDRSIRGGLVAAATGSIAILMVSRFS